MTIRRIEETRLPTKWGDFTMIAYDSGVQDFPHVALLNNSDQVPLVRIHSECMTGDLFGSKRCDCGDQLHLALKETNDLGGVVLYLRQEGRGIGLVNKMKAYNLQDEGMNTAEANVHLGFDEDQREYSSAVFILRDLGYTSIRLMTNNPLKIEAIESAGITVERVPLVIAPNDENKEYLDTKKDQMGHLF